jgi:hypothetical protein
MGAPHALKPPEEGMMSPFKEIAPMTPEEEAQRRYKINRAVQWVWRGMVIVILIFQIVTLVLYAMSYDRWLKSQAEQNKALAYLVDVTVDKSTIDPLTNQATPWIVEIYRNLSEEIRKDQEARETMVGQMQDYTQQGIARQKKNEELVLEQKQNTEAFGAELDQFKKDIEGDLSGERADRESWAKSLLDSMTKLEQSSAVVKKKVEQRIINPSDVAPIYHQNRILKKQNKQLKEEKKPVVKIWPWQ